MTTHGPGQLSQRTERARIPADPARDPGGTSITPRYELLGPLSALALHRTDYEALLLAGPAFDDRCIKGDLDEPCLD
jgi:hypothetical protein